MPMADRRCGRTISITTQQKGRKTIEQNTCSIRNVGVFIRARLDFYFLYQNALLPAEHVKCCASSRVSCIYHMCQWILFSLTFGYLASCASGVAWNALLSAWYLPVLWNPASSTNMALHRPRWRKRTTWQTIKRFAKQFVRKQQTRKRSKKQRSGECCFWHTQRQIQGKQQQRTDILMLLRENIIEPEINTNI